MKEQALSRFEFEEEFKEKVVDMVLCKNVSAEQVAKKITCQTTILINWINNYKRRLEQGAVNLVPMEKPETKDTAALKRRIKDLKKALEKLMYSFMVLIL